MGYEKAITLGEKICAWTRNGKSLLATRPVKINTAGLKLATPLQTDTIQLSTHIGKHKIPRYLYHMTSLENYQKMLESGVLKPMGCRLPNGVYMLELESFGKYWSKNFRNDLCDMIFRSGDSNIVMLKIPTKNLKVPQLRIRTQAQVENGALGKNVQKELGEWFNFSRMPEERKKIFEQLVQQYGKETALKKYIDMMPKELEPVTKGYEAKLSSLFKQRKADLEFIYTDEIPIKDISIVGTAKYKDLFGIEYNFDQLDARQRNIAKPFLRIYLSQNQKKEC